MRINKYLAQKKICSRREADRLIADGAVFINGTVAQLGAQVEDGDEVTVRKGVQKELVYLAFYKPKDVITHSPQHGEKSIYEVATFPTKVFPLGRLDKASHGLLLLTNDGRVTDRLLHPDREHEKEYIVRVQDKVSDGFLQNFRTGVTLDDGYVTKPCRAERMDAQTFRVILTEGKKHQIRRMCETLGERVSDLKRVRVMNIHLDTLCPAQYRKIAGKELQVFLKALGL